MPTRQHYPRDLSPGPYALVLPGRPQIVWLHPDSRWSSELSPGTTYSSISALVCACTGWSAANGWKYLRRIERLCPMYSHIGCPAVGRRGTVYRPSVLGRRGTHRRAGKERT